MTPTTQEALRDHRETPADLGRTIEQTAWQTEAESTGREIRAIWIITAPIAALIWVVYLFGRRPFLADAGAPRVETILSTDIPMGAALAALGLMTGGVTFLDSKVSHAADVLNRDDCNESQRIRALVEADQDSRSAQIVSAAAVFLAVVASLSALTHSRSIFGAIAAFTLAGWVTRIAARCQPAARAFQDIAARQRRERERVHYARFRDKWPTSATRHGVECWAGLACQIVLVSLGMTVVVLGVAAAGRSPVTPTAVLICVMVQLFVVVLMSMAAMQSVSVWAARQRLLAVGTGTYLFLAAFFVSMQIVRLSPILIGSVWQLCADLAIFGVLAILIPLHLAATRRHRTTQQIRKWLFRPYLGMIMRRYMDAQYERNLDPEDRRPR